MHHACMHTLAMTNAIKIIGSHSGRAYVTQQMQVQLVGMPGAPIVSPPA